MATSQRSIHLLHVDDDPDFADLTATYLERENDRFDIETATSADEGLQRIASRPPDCVVSDYDMPGASGIEFLEAVRDQHPELPFILYTGKGSEAVAGEAVSAGVTDYIQKQSGTDQYLLLANRIENAVTNYRSQQAAERKEQRLELFFEDSPLGAIQWDADFNFERMNDRAEEILGYDETALRGESWERIVADGDRDSVGDVVEHLLEGDSGTHIINKNVCKDGTIRTCEWHNRAVTDADGNVQSVFSKFQDVTDRENRKTELEEYATIIEALTDAVYVLDDEGRFTYVNDELVELVGYDRETILGNTPSLIKGEEAVEQAEHQLGRLLSSDGPDTVSFEVTLHPRDGEPTVCRDHMGVLPYEGDQFDGSVGTLRDITEQKARQRELEAVNRQYQTLVENFPNGAVFLFDADLEYIRAGGRGLAAVGLSPDEVQGGTPHDLFPAEIADETADYYRDTLDGDSCRFEQEYRGDRYQIQTAPVRTSHGEIAHGMAVSTNVTDQTERRRKLERQNERLEEFATIVSHDLRNPLNVAEDTLELAQETCESDLLGRAADAIGRSQALIDDLLTLARESDGTAEVEPVALADVAHSSWQTVDTKRATLETDTQQLIEADGSRLRQLFENLYRNAVEHGGDDVTVSVGATDEGFYVADTGTGIPEGDREEIFEAGYTTNGGRTGFGLRVVRQIAEAHGWGVGVTDGDHGGTRFEITGVEIIE